MSTPTFSSTDLHRLQRQLDSWRARQNGRPRLTPAVWTSATELARSHGVGHTARTLRLDYYRLQRRLRAGEVASRELAVLPK